MIIINVLMIHVCFIVKPSAALGRFTIVTRSGKNGVRKNVIENPDR